jgi:hypothetical protein
MALILLAALAAVTLIAAGFAADHLSFVPTSKKEAFAFTSIALGVVLLALDVLFFLVWLIL